MDNPVTTRQSPSVPDVLRGEIYKNVGKFARGAIMFAFHQIGGPQALADWAKDNKADFYVKLFPKIVTRESEVHHVKTLDDLMEVLDAEYEVVEEVVATAETPDQVGWYSPEEEDARASDKDWEVDRCVEFPDA